MSNHKLFLLNLKTATSNIIKVTFSSSAKYNYSNKNKVIQQKACSSIDMGPEPNYQKLNANTFKNFEYNNEFELATNKAVLPKINLVSANSFCLHVFCRL